MGEQRKKNVKPIVMGFTFLFIVVGMLILHCEYLKAKEKEYFEKISFYESIAQSERQWIHSNQVSNGAILFYREGKGTSGMIPYFSNIAARSLLLRTCTQRDNAVVRSYLDWYLSHINQEEDDPVNGDGTIYDYYVVLENDKIVSEESKGTYDSVDSYAATFLSLLRAYYQQTEDSEYFAISWDKIVRVTHAMLNTIDEDGLSMTNNEKRIKYLMDNAEVNQGLKDAVFLLDSLAQKKQFSKDMDYKQISNLKEKLVNALERNTKAIEETLWNETEQRYELGLDKKNRKLEFQGWDSFYADAVAQLFPIAFELIEPDSERAQDLYERFCKEYKWEKMEHFNKGETDFYWCIIGYVAALMDDDTRVDQFLTYYRSNIMEKHKYPLYNAEAGWLLFTCDKMIERYQEKITLLDSLKQIFTPFLSYVKIIEEL